jgi:hypothetical protein
VVQGGLDSGLSAVIGEIGLIRIFGDLSFGRSFLLGINVIILWAYLVSERHISIAIGGLSRSRGRG